MDEVSEIKSKLKMIEISEKEVLPIVQGPFDLKASPGLSTKLNTVTPMLQENQDDKKSKVYTKQQYKDFVGIDPPSPRLYWESTSRKIKQNKTNDVEVQDIKMDKTALSKNENSNLSKEDIVTSFPLSYVTPPPEDERFDFPIGGGFLVPLPQ